MMRHGGDGLQMRAETSIYDIWRSASQLNKPLTEIRTLPFGACSDGVILGHGLGGLGDQRWTGLFFILS
jgi:hypothetical protein